MLRLSWNICGQTGTGEWKGDSLKPMLEMWVDLLNLEFGSGTHWLEESVENNYSGKLNEITGVL